MYGSIFVLGSDEEVTKLLQEQFAKSWPVLLVARTSLRVRGRSDLSSLACGPPAELRLDGDSCREGHHLSLLELPMLNSKCVNFCERKS